MGSPGWAAAALSSDQRNRRAQGTAVGLRRELLMSITSKVLAAAATLAVAGGLSTARTLPAAAATPHCRAVAGCIQIFSAKFGTNASPGFVETGFQGSAAAGQPTIVAPPSSSSPAGDLIATHPASGPLVSDFFAAGLVSAAVNSYYGSELAVQIEYAPFGEPTGLCSALATTASQNEGLTLQPCSTPGTTVLIVDTADSPATAPARFPHCQRLDHGLHPPIRDDHPR
jgi:hypothetical protein